MNHLPPAFWNAFFDEMGKFAAGPPIKVHPVHVPKIMAPTAKTAIKLPSQNPLGGSSTRSLAERQLGHKAVKPPTSLQGSVSDAAMPPPNVPTPPTHAAQSAVSSPTSR